jgi:two-component system, OmpR family, sensor kinase
VRPPGTRSSLQWRLSIGLFAAILLTGGVAGGLSFVWALHDANEILDGTLEDTAGLIVNGQMAIPAGVSQLPGSEPDNDVLLIPLARRPAAAGSDFGNALAGLPDGLRTAEWQGHRWRVLIGRTMKGDRIAVAQQTEVRDEIAQHSAVRTVIPVLLLIPVLILLVRGVVRRTLAPMSRLARHVETNPMDHAASLPDVEVPLEVQPFVHAIKGLLAELTAALARQQRFVANAAHELRSPMAALQLQAANIERVVHEEEARQRLVHLQAGMQRMQHLLEQLLSMARSEAPSGKLRPIRITEVAKDVLAQLVAAADAKGLDLGTERFDGHLCVQATALDLATMLRNVVENAIKHSPPGAAVTLSVYADEGDAVIAVQDEGPGIPESQRLRVFDPFYRAPGSATTGTGLGLSIVAAIAKRLDARVHLSSGPDGRGLLLEYRQSRVACGPGE